MDERTYPKYCNRYLRNGEELDVTDAHGVTRHVRVTGTPGFRDTFRAQVADENGAYGEPVALDQVGIDRNADGMYSVERAYALHWHGGGGHFVVGETRAYELVAEWRGHGVVTGDLKEDREGIRFEDDFGRRADLRVNVRD